MKLFRKKKKQESLARIAARFVQSKTIKKLSKKDLEIVIDGEKFHFIDIPLKRKDLNG